MADDGWVEWHGGECPVPAGTKIDLRFRDMKDSCNVFAHVWNWTSLGSHADIVAYRIAKPAEPPKPDTSAEDALWHGYAKAALGALVQRGVRGDTPEKLAEAAGVVADAMLTEARKRGRV